MVYNNEKNIASDGKRFWVLTRKNVVGDPLLINSFFFLSKGLILGRRALFFNLNFEEFSSAPLHDAKKKLLSRNYNLKSRHS